MQSIEHTVGSDLRAGRMLVQMSLRQAEQACGISHDTLQRLEAGRQVRAQIKQRVADTLATMGVEFLGPGWIHHRDGAIAPTPEAVGAFHGFRIRKARWRLAWTPQRLAGEARVSLPIVLAMERSRFLNEKPTLAFYRVVKALQMEGTIFGPWSSGRADRSLVPRPIRWKHSRNPMRDYIQRTDYHRQRWYDEIERQDPLHDPSKVPPKEPLIEWPDHWTQAVRARIAILRAKRGDH